MEHLQLVCLGDDHVRAFFKVSATPCVVLRKLEAGCQGQLSIVTPLLGNAEKNCIVLYRRIRFRFLIIHRSHGTRNKQNKQQYSLTTNDKSIPNNRYYYYRGGGGLKWFPGNVKPRASLRGGALQVQFGKDETESMRCDTSWPMG